MGHRRRASSGLQSGNILAHGLCTTPLHVNDSSLSVRASSVCKKKQTFLDGPVHWPFETVRNKARVDGDRSGPPSRAALSARAAARDAPHAQCTHTSTLHFRDLSQPSLRSVRAWKHETRLRVCWKLDVSSRPENSVNPVRRSSVEIAIQTPPQFVGYSLDD